MLVSVNDLALVILQTLGQSGIRVSVCYGPGPNGCYWSVQCQNNDTGAEFDKPYAAKSFRQAVAIAVNESKKRGWIPAEVAEMDARP